MILSTFSLSACASADKDKIENVVIVQVTNGGTLQNRGGYTIDVYKRQVFESVILELVVLGSVVLESVVLESVVLGSVVLGSVVLGSVVLGSVVLGSGSFFVLVITKEFSLLVTVLSKSVGTLVCLLYTSRCV